jgi:hypothetical protein
VEGESGGDVRMMSGILTSWIDVGILGEKLPL